MRCRKFRAISNLRISHSKIPLAYRASSKGGPGLAMYDGIVEFIHSGYMDPELKNYIDSFP